MDNTLPYVTAAFFCERIIEGKDGILSAIRIIDRAQPEAGSLAAASFQDQKITMSLQITALIALKAGKLDGKFNVRIIGEKPSGQRADLQTLPIELHGKDSGVNVVVNLTVVVTEEGTHWFDVLFENQLVTKMPLTVLPVRIQGRTTSDGPPKQV